MNEIVGIAAPFSGIKPGGLERLYGLVSGVRELGEAQSPIPGAVVECGVCNGGSAAVLWRAAGTDRKLWLFDSFEGMPYPNEIDGGRAFTKYNYRMEVFGDWNKGNIETVKDVLGRAGPLANVEIVQGWVEETLPAAAGRIGPIAVLHLDMDFYSPTVCALKWLYPLVAPGGLVIFDDYNSWPGCKAAVDEYMEKHHLSWSGPGQYLRVSA